MHQSFVTMAPQTRERVGDSHGNERRFYFFHCPRSVQEMPGIYYVGKNGSVINHWLSLQCGAVSRNLLDKKLKVPAMGRGYK